MKRRQNFIFVHKKLKQRNKEQTEHKPQYIYIFSDSDKYEMKLMREVNEMEVK